MAVLHVKNGNKWEVVGEPSAAFPVGAPVPWASNTLPTVGTWAFMKGQSFNKTAYPELAKIYTNGVLDDMRGRAIVGKMDNETVRAAEAGNVKSHTHSGSATSTNLGTKTSNTTGNHRHTAPRGDTVDFGQYAYAGRARPTNTYTGYAGNHSHTTAIGSHGHTVSIGSTGGTKNTVDNRKFNFIVRML